MESAAGYEGPGVPAFGDAVKARESRYYSVAALAYYKLHKELKETENALLAEDST